MKIRTFKLEDYLCKHEFSAPFLLCCSDAESWSLSDILAMANEEEQSLWQNLHLGYTEVRGLPKLRKAIVDQNYPGLSMDQVICFSGAEEGIFCSLYALLEPEDHVIVLTPCYQSLFEIPRIKGCSISTIDLKEENDWRIDLKDIQKAITPKTKWVIMNFPHNPTGQIISDQEQNELIALLDHHGISLFSDEVYRLLGPSQTTWGAPAAVTYNRAISLGVMSKAYGLAGLRVGWIACQDKTLLEKIEKVRHYTSICNSALSEVISLIALRCQKSIVGRNNDIVDYNLGHLDQFVQTHEDLFSWVRPQGGCVGFMRYHGQETVEKFCDNLLAETGVLLLPSSIYEISTPHFRIGFGRKNMPEVLGRLEKFITR